MGWDSIKPNWGGQIYDAGKDEDGNLALNDKIYKKFQEKNFQIIKKVEEIGLPQRGEQIRLITTNPFNTISIIDYISKKETIVEGKFVIFAINQSAAKMLIDMKTDGRLINASFIISSIRNAGHKSKSIAVDQLKTHFENLIYVNSHAKITLLKTSLGNHYCIEGSGNLSFNGRLEQYIIDNDKDLFDWSKEWIAEIEQYKMI
jgi:hypothetical protein